MVRGVVSRHGLLQTSGGDCSMGGRGEPFLGCGFNFAPVNNITRR